MNWRGLTICVILFTIIFPFAYTISIQHFVGKQYTISAVLQDLGYRFPIIPALLGGLFFALLAHWWWPVYPPQ